MPLGPMKTKKQKRAGMKTVMDEFKSGSLHSGSKSGPKVKSRKQAIAIGLSQTGQSKRGKPKKMAKAKKPRGNPAKTMSTENFEKTYGDEPLA